MDAAMHTANLDGAAHTADEGQAIWPCLPANPWPDKEASRGSRKANTASSVPCPLPCRPAARQANWVCMYPSDGMIKSGDISFDP